MGSFAPPSGVSLSAAPATVDAHVATNLTGAYSGGRPPVGLNLTFGDGSYEVGGDQATHVHTAAGSYTASLNVTDLQGRSARATTTVTVNYDLTDLVIHAGPSAPSVGKNVSLSSSICGGTAPFSSG